MINNNNPTINKINNTILLNNSSLIALCNFIPIKDPIITPGIRKAVIFITSALMKPVYVYATVLLKAKITKLATHVALKIVLLIS